MSYSSGIYTIGLITSNYMTIDAAIADYAPGANGLSGNLTWIIEADTTWTVNFNLHGLNGFTFKITAMNYHGGNPNNGVLITMSAGDQNILVQHGSATYCIIEKVKFRNGRLVLVGFSTVGTYHTIGHIVRNCIFLTSNLLGRQTDDTSYSVRQMFYNNKFYNSAFEYDYSYSVSPEVNGTQGVIENNTFYADVGNYSVAFRGGGGGISRCYCTVRNNALPSPVIGSYGFKHVLPGLVMPYAYNNATSNNTALVPAGGGGWRNIDVASKVSIVPADEFESLNSADADFLFLKNGSIDLSASRSPAGNLATKQKCKFTPSLSFGPSTCTIGIAGVVPTYAGVLDIADKARPGGDDLYSIGCHEQQYV